MVHCASRAVLMLPACVCAACMRVCAAACALCDVCCPANHSVMRSPATHPLACS